MRRVLTVLLLLAVVAAAGWTLYRWNNSANAAGDVWRSIPDQAAVVIELPDAWGSWDRFTHTSQVWNAFEQVPELAAIGRLMSRVVERTQNDAALRDALSGTPLLIALMQNGGDGPGCLFAGALHKTDAATLGNFGALLGLDAATSATLLKGATTTVRPDTALPELSLAVHDGLWLLASSPLMMEEALLQCERGTPITSDTLFAKARATLGAGADAHVIFHSARAQRLVRAKWKMGADDLDLPEGWVALDVRPRADALLMSGLIAQAKEHGMLTNVEHQGMGPWNLARLLPASASAWDIQQVTDAQRYLADRGATADTSDGALAAALFHWVHGAMGVASASGSIGTAPAHWALFQTDDPETASASLNGLCTACDTINYRGVRLTRLPMQQAHERLLGPLFEPFVQPWWALLGDVVLFAPEPAPLQAAIDAWNDGNTLAQDQRTSAWFDRISDEAARTWWCDVARSSDLLSEARDSSSTARPLDRLWSQLGGLTVQLAPGHHGMTNISVDLQTAPQEVQESGALWSVALGKTVTRPPAILLNHTSKTREVLVQDVENTLHLIGSTGKVLWTRAIDGPVLGEVVQVDRFKNGKLQLLFNTAARLYLIDRNGKDLGGFPVSLPENASAPLSAPDYDGTKEYRVLIPTVQARILNYTLDGKAVEGWVPPQLPTTTSIAVEHLRLKNKDHLVIIDDGGTITVLDRKGAPRFVPTLKLGRGNRVIAIGAALDIGACRVLWNDSIGNSLGGTLNGMVDTLARASDMSPSDVQQGLVQEDLDHNGSMDVVLHAKSVPTMQDAARPVNSTGIHATATAFTRFADLNIDGTMDLITVTQDGRVVVSKAP
ncbi:MAG: hypothetical protein ABI432_15245 [Flavobacteriales bacterium]